MNETRACSHLYTVHTTQFVRNVQQGRFSQALSGSRQSMLCKAIFLLQAWAKDEINVPIALSAFRLKNSEPLI